MFQYLFSPIRIKNMELKNRLVMTAMGNRLVGGEGSFTDRARYFYAARAKGGVGLVMSQSGAVEKGAMTHRNALAVYDDRHLPGMADMADCVHAAGAKVGLQLHHTGPIGSSSVFGIQPVAASSVPFPESWADEGKEIPRALTKEEIADLVGKFAAAAARAKKTGFDTVEIHAAHRCLINSFLSSRWNQRTDEYGGDLKGRARFVIEIIKAVRETVGPDFPIFCKFNGEEYDIEGGTKLAQTVELAPMLQAAGADLLDVSSVPYATPFLKQGSRIYMAEAIKKVVTIPVAAVGRITPQLGDQFVKEGKADLIMIGRGIIAEPEIANKAREGRLEDIRPCVGCENCRKRNINVQGKVIVDPNLVCAINPTAGKEEMLALKPAGKIKKVVVVGGGPGGMEAALTAAQRGHKVTLYEKDDRLGGCLVLAGMINENYERLANYLDYQVRKAGVDVQLGKEVTPALIDSFKPDALIICGGGITLKPKIKGVDRNIAVFYSDIKAVTSKHQKENPFLAFGKNVIIIGDGLVGCEIADFLAQTGRQVTLVELPQDNTNGVMPLPMNSLRAFYFGEIGKRGGTHITGWKLEEITSKGLKITDKEGKTRVIPADNVVVTGGTRPNTELVEALKGTVPEVYSVGDCADPRGIQEAINEAYGIVYRM